MRQGKANFPIAYNYDFHVVSLSESVNKFFQHMLSGFIIYLCCLIYNSPLNSQGKAKEAL